MRRKRIGIALITTSIIVLALAGVRTTRASDPAQAVDGKAIYTQRCEVCHGANGDGNGPAAEMMFPRPRDFTLGAFEVRTTASDAPPTDEDLINVIRNGMPGSTMPAWRDVLSGDEIAAVAAYIKTFSDVFDGDAPQPMPIGNRVNADEASIARGAEVYREVQCFRCHGDEGRGDGPSAFTLTDEAGQLIYPADLTQAWLFRGGGTAEDIYKRIMTGMQGSPMPSFADALVDAEGNLDEQKRWDLANYVDSLSADINPGLPEALVGRRIEGDIPDDPAAAEWQNAPATYVPLAGQIMREPRNFTPAIAGVWVRALHNANDVALWVQWNDRQQNTGANGEPADEFAVQFPATRPEGDERPYFVFGDAAHPVNLWTWTAGAGAPIETIGRGSDTIEPQATQNLNASVGYAAGQYTVVFRRALNTGDAEDIAFTPETFIPIAFAASDGLLGEEPGAGAISTWHQLYLEQPVPPTRYLAVPVVVAVTAALEGLALWLARRNARQMDDG